jgi:hypothetical protein
MKKLPIYISLLFVLTCAKEDSQAPNTPPTQIVKQYTLTASAGDGGSVTGGGTFASGTQVSLTATPTSGYSFSGWSNGSTANPLTVTLNSNTSITANFQVIVNSYALSVSAGEGGSVSTEGGEYEEGTEVTLTATASEGYRFTGWSDGSTEESITITLNSDTALTADFELIPIYTVTVTGEGGVVTGAGEYQEGSEVTLTANANQGYVFNGWEDGVNQNTRSITIDSDKSINASFISIFDYFNLLTNNVLNISISNINKTTGNYNNWYRPFIDYNKLIDREFYSFVYVLENGDVGLAPYPEDEHHGHEQLWHNFLDINNNEIPDMVFTGTTIRSEKHGEVYVVIDNELKYRFNSGQAGSRKILIGDLDNNGSDDAVLIATGIDQQPYSGSTTKIIYFTPNSYEYVNLDDDPSYFHTGSIGDINNDGNLDLIIANNQGPEDTFTYIGDGNKNFSKIKVGEVKDFAQKTATEFFDLNNDGILDLISGGWETPTIGLDGNIIEDWRNRTELSYGNGDGTFDIENSIQFPEIDYWGKVNAFIFHDIDNDGDTEIIINRTKGHEDYPSVDNDNSYDGIKIQILKKQGNEYVNHQIIDGPEGWFDLPPTWIEWIPWIKLFDVNSDGIMDIVPDHENINDPSFNQLNRYWGLYYRGIPGGTFEIDFFDPDSINN